MLETVARGDVVVMLMNSLMIAGLCLFLQECMEPRMILRRYYLWLTYHWIINWRKGDRWRRKILQPLGLCIYCNSFWVSSIFFAGKYGLSINLFLFAGMTFLWVKLCKKIFD